VRVAIAGLGTAATRGHLPAIARLASRGALTLVGAADPNAPQQADMGARFPGVPLFASAESMLASVACDVLVVASEPSMHADLVALGLAQQLHVVCEKPLVISRSQYDCVAQAHAQHPDRGIIPVHQYRYSPTWVSISRYARLAARLRIPFSLAVEVQRPGTDALAVSSWRTDRDQSGGMLADHGVHYLALAWTVDEHLDVLAGVRIWRGTSEHSDVSVRLRSGLLTIQLVNGAQARRTSINFYVANGALTWRDETMKAVIGGRTVLIRRVEALTHRSHVDSLYHLLYLDIVRNLSRPSWRANRTAEALTVSRALVSLLDDPVGLIPCDAAPLAPHSG
jgi:predicted dehydrogenase